MHLLVGMRDVGRRGSILVHIVGNYERSKYVWFALFEEVIVTLCIFVNVEVVGETMPIHAQSSSGAHEFLYIRSHRIEKWHNCPDQKVYYIFLKTQFMQ